MWDDYGNFYYDPIESTDPWPTNDAPPAMDLIDNGDGSLTDLNTGYLYDSDGYQIGYDNFDGTWFDLAGNLFANDGTPILTNADANGGTPAADTGGAGFNEWGDPSWYFGDDGQGNEVYAAIAPDGSTYYAVYDAAGNFLGTVDDYGNVLSDPARAANANSAARTISPQSIFSGGGGAPSAGALAQQLGQMLTQSRAAGAPASQQAQLLAAQRAAQSQAATDDTKKYLIAAGALLAVFALTRQRAA